MKITAIIAEYNPFHNGHLKQLKKAKKDTGADCLVVCMSGSFTQHGDIAIEDKFTRAQWAIDAGADLVLELPTVYSLSSAKGFAEGALKTLSLLGEFTLSFGTESEELEELKIASEFLASESNDLSRSIKGFLSDGYSLAKSRTKALDLIRPDISNMLQSPNNILAVEYMKAGAKYGDKVQYYSVERKPDDGKKYLCSTKIRELIKDGYDEAQFVPEFVKIENPTDLNKYSIASSYALKSASKEQLKEIANIFEGMENKIANSEFNSLEDFEGFTSKRYTKSTLKRIAASVTIGLTKELVELANNEKPYTTVLAIKNSKKKVLLPLLSQADGYFYFKSSDCPNDSPVKKLIDLDTKAYKIQKFCQNK